jgi:hypothetical protein
MEIPRQKKTVRLAVTRPSVKKGAIVTLLKNRLTAETISIHQLLKFGLLPGCFPELQTPALVSTLQLAVNELGVFYLFSFLLRRETVC